MARRITRYFFVYLVDQDNKTFNIQGPTSDDTAITRRTLTLQSEGRKVTISTTKSTDLNNLPSKENLISNGLEGYKHDPKLDW